MTPRLLALATCLAGLTSTIISAPSAHAAQVDKIIAGVNNEVILQSDVNQFERTLMLRKELDPLFSFSEEFEGGTASKAKIVSFLIEERLITQSYKISDQEVDQDIQGIQRTNNIDRDELVKFLQSKGFSFSDYRDLISIGHAKRELLDKEIRNRVNISDDDIRNVYYKRSMKNESVPLEYSIQLLTVNNSTYKSPAGAENAAQTALREIRQGQAFAEVAKRVSDDPSAAQGGELGYLAADQLAGPIKSAVKNLQIGSVSDVVKTPSGYMIIKLIDARSTESQKYLAAKEQIREQLAKEEYKKQLHLWAERARNTAYVYTN